MVAKGTIHGHNQVTIENNQLSVSILPDKGADVYSLRSKPEGIEFLYSTLSSLQTDCGPDEVPIVRHYEGGWQELFPNTGPACTTDGVAIPVHGEVAILPWTCEIISEYSVVFRVETTLVPFGIERLMALAPNKPHLKVKEMVTNRTRNTQSFVWGHHIVLGGDFIEAGCRYKPAARTIITPKKGEFKTPDHARLAFDQTSAWPFAKTITGGVEDLSILPGPDAQSHDSIFLLDLEQGFVEVSNSRLGREFILEWDSELFRCLNMWQPLGGHPLEPWKGSYGVGVEPWRCAGNLRYALDRGEAILCGPGESIETEFHISIT